MDVFFLVFTPVIVIMLVAILSEIKATRGAIERLEKRAE